MSPTDWAWLGLDVLAALLLSSHILLNKRDPRAASSWILLVWALPFVGALLYWLFGINRVARAARRRALAPPAARPLPAPPGPSAGLGALRKASDSLAWYPLCGRNRIEPLIDGDEAYPAMLSAINHARRSVCLSSFIFDQDQTGEAFTQALRRAAQNGAKVRVLVDGIGAWGPGRRLLRLVSEAGGRVVSFWPRGRFLRHPGLNLRNHRKILAVDGRLGFTGGMNISERHIGLGRQPKARDIHFKVQGPAVAHLVGVFAHDWRNASGEHLDGPAWYPPLKAAGRDAARGFASGPDHDFERIYELLLAALRNARKRVDICSPYFLPDRPILTALRTARRSGVTVRVLIPRHSDHRFMHWGARGYLWELVEAGVEVREVLGGFIHSKLLVVDSSWCMVGSANLDPRSFRLNFEFNLEVDSPRLAGELQGYIEGLCEHSYMVSAQDLRREPLAARLRNQAVKLFSPYL